MYRIDRQAIRSWYEKPKAMVDQAMVALEPFFKAVEDGSFLLPKPAVDPMAMAAAMTASSQKRVRLVVLLSVSDQADGFRAHAEADEPAYEQMMVDPVAYGVERELSGPLVKRLEERMTAPAWAPYIEAVGDAVLNVVVGFLTAADAGDAAAFGRISRLVELLPKTVPLTAMTGEPDTFFALVR